jgi:TolB protein
MDVDGNNVRQVTNRSGYVGHPSWSVNGQIAFNAGGDDGGSWELYVIDSSGSNQRQLTNNTVSDWSPEFSPDGQQILYLHSLSRDDEAALYVMNADGTDARLLYNSVDYDWGQGWSPDGQRILFTREIDNVSYIYRMDADGSNVTFVADRGRYPKEVP